MVRRYAAKIVPDDSVVQALQPYSRQLTFVVVLGTWCSDSQKQVPAFFALMDALHIGDKHIELIGVDRQKRSSTVDVAPLRIEYVPTFIVFCKGKEIGRIVEAPKVSLEKDLLQLLQDGQSRAVALGCAPRTENSLARAEVYITGSIFSRATRRTMSKWERRCGQPRRLAKICSPLCDVPLKGQTLIPLCYFSSGFFQRE